MTGDSSNNLAFDVDNSNKVHLALLKPQIGFDPRLWAYGTSPSFSLTTFPRSNVNGVIDLALSTDGHPRVAFTDFFVDVYAEWNGVGFSTETLKFSFLGNTFQLRRKLNLTLSRENHPYRLAPTLVGTTLTLGLSAKLPVPPRLEQTDQSPSSIQWSWSGAPSPAVSGYRVRRADDNADVSGILTPTTTSWTLTGTNANEAVSAALETIYPGFVLVSSSVTSFSAAVAPRDVGLSRSGEGPLSVNWSANGNSPETSYRLDFRGADGSALSETVQSASTVYPFLNPRVPYGLTVTTLGRDGTERSLSTVESVIATAQETRLSFSLDGLIVEARLFPVEGRPSPVVAASPVERYPALTDALWAGSDRGFQLVMDRPLPDDQGATVSVQFPSGWLDTLPAGVKVLARYDSAHARWVPLPTREGSRQLIAQVDGWGVFQVLVKTPTSGGTPPRTAYPNPFRPTDGRTMIWRDVSPGGQVKVNALDGRLVCTLLGNETGLVEWDGRDADGAAVKSGVYLLSFEDQGATTNVKVIVER
ncbi:MAG: T9SS type A sorting domain-containing protein [Elusimicrobia bacterium]|nr:T9SS type A sorting domain-containing protein [Elusimicrobiota bacterium]